VNADGRADGLVEAALGRALGHVRNATERLLGGATETTERLLLGISCLDLQSMFGEVWPVWIPNQRSASESLAGAEEELAAILDEVPLAIWAALRSLREQVNDGHG
jgi:hypothetical protein